MKTGLTKRLEIALQNLFAAMREVAEADRLCRAYQSAFENPYAGGHSQADLDAAKRAVGAVVADAIRAGHGGRWVLNRLPRYASLLVGDYYHYGVRIERHECFTDISARDVYVSGWTRP